MGRSGHLSGATVALELLPKALPTAQSPQWAQVLRNPPPGGTAPHRLSGLALVMDNRTCPLDTLGGLPVFASDGPTGPDGPHPTTGDPQAELGEILLGTIESGAAEAGSIYRIALCLARLNRHADGYRLISLLDTDRPNHPAVLALKGYLALQTGDVENGRRALARSALASRGSPDDRSILHFTQHVLLVHQFGG